jgi:FkbM family methyltransferase
MKYSVVIPTYNHCDDLLRPCLESIFKYTDMSEVEVLVSANGCTDNTRWYLESLKNQFTRIGFGDHFKVIWSDTPLGYPVACNVAIRHSTADKIVLLNNDCVLIEQDKNTWLNLLDAPFESPKTGISCVVKNRCEITNREFAIFFCVMVHRKVFETIGLLNPEYGVGGCEDIDFCIEAEEAGFEVTQCGSKFWDGKTFVGEMPVYHKGEGTVYDTALVQDWDNKFRQNQLKLAQKYSPAKAAQLSLAWMAENGPEAAELYKEVVVENVYQVSEDLIKGRPVIDIGANVGTFAILAASLGASKIVAAEPVSETYDRLVQNLQRASANAVAMKAAVMDKVGTVEIGVNPKSGHNSLYKSESGSESVPSVTLADLLEHVEGNDIFLKMDCEGAEYDILMAATQEEMDRIGRLAIEIHGDMHPKYKGLETLWSRLEALGMKLVDRKQIGAWDVDSEGRMVNYRDLPRTNEIWSR